MPKAKWRIEQVQGIVANHQAAKIGGKLIDVQSANLVANCYEMVSEARRAEWVQIPVHVLIERLWKIAKRA